MLLKVTHRALRAPSILAVLLVAIALLWSCGGGGSSGTSDPGSITITTTALPNGQVGRAYSAVLAARGGSAPLSWSLTGGALPGGLTLGSNGALSGTPTTAAAGTSLTFTVSDAGSHSQSATLHINISPANITVSASPARAALTVTQVLSLTATTNDLAGVRWSIGSGGGSFSQATTASGAPVTFRAGATAGAYTITATSVTDATQSVSVSLGITDLAGVYTYHNDVTRAGANTQEFALTTGNLTSATFGKLFSCA